MLERHLERELDSRQEIAAQERLVAELQKAFDVARNEHGLYSQEAFAALGELRDAKNGLQELIALSATPAIEQPLNGRQVVESLLRRANELYSQPREGGGK